MSNAPNTPRLTDRKALAANRARAQKMAQPADFLHQEAITEAKERLMAVNRTFDRIAIVSGWSDIWQQAFPNAHIVLDDDVLALQPKSYDLVIHAMALHWSDDPVGQLVQCRHALKPDGLFLGLFFGGQTLHELRASLAEAEAEVTGGLSPRILPMGEIRDLGALLQRAGFALPVADSLTQKVTYSDALRLMADLRAMGEGNALANRLKHPTNRMVIARAAQIYAQAFPALDGRILATFEILCLTGWAPHDSQQQPLRPGSAAQRLADALNATEHRLPDPSRQT